LMGKAEAASFVASMLTRGSQQRSREDIARRLDELKARLSISGDAQSVNVSANTVREHLPDVIDLISELLQQPAFPEREFAQLRSQAITGIESQMTEPDAIGSNAMSRHFSPWPKDHPLYVPTFQEQIDGLRALTLDEVRDFHAGFYGAGDGEIAVLGDFDTDALQAQLDERFGSWTRPQPFVRIANPYRPVATAAHVSETPDKANAIWFARADLPLSDSHPDYPALVVGNFIFGGGSLSSRLADRIREKDGLSYGVGAQFSASALDERGLLMAYAIAAPENVDRVEAAFREEVARLLENGVTETEFRNAVDGLLIARARGRGEDPSLVRQLRSDAYLGRSMAWSAAFEDQLRALSLEQVNDAVRRHFGAVEFSLFRAGDFNKN
jgi:zinc protease